MVMNYHIAPHVLRVLHLTSCLLCMLHDVPQLLTLDILSHCCCRYVRPMAPAYVVKDGRALCAMSVHVRLATPPAYLVTAEG